jgi:hypothetical protein
MSMPVIAYRLAPAGSKASLIARYLVMLIPPQSHLLRRALFACPFGAAWKMYLKYCIFSFQSTKVEAIYRPIKAHRKPMGFYRTTTRIARKRGHGKGHAPAQAMGYATLKVRIFVMSLVSSLRFSSSSTYK